MSTQIQYYFYVFQIKYNFTEKERSFSSIVLKRQVNEGRI